MIPVRECGVKYTLKNSNSQMISRLSCIPRIQSAGRRLAWNAQRCQEDPIDRFADITERKSEGQMRDETP